MQKWIFRSQKKTLCKHAKGQSPICNYKSSIYHSFSYDYEHSLSFTTF